VMPNCPAPDTVKREVSCSRCDKALPQGNASDYSIEPLCVACDDNDLRWHYEASSLN
jgi:formylmethanofuran dehydrogenase subunit E